MYPLPIYIFPKPKGDDWPTVQEAINDLKEIFLFESLKGKIKIIIDENKIQHDSIIFSLGGDGTMLSAMRLGMQYSAAVYGINLGNIGFLTDYTYSPIRKNEFRELILDLLNYEQSGFNPEDFRNFSKFKWQTNERMAIETELGPYQKTIALNEFSLARKESDSMIFYKLDINGQHAGVHRANSLLISTPSGCTGYALSVGGALILPSADVIQIVPVAPFTLTSRPLIVSDSARIKVTVWGGKEVVLRGDGQLVKNYPTERDTDTVTLTFRGGGVANVLTSNQNNYFTNLNTKLGWTNNWKIG